MQVCQRDVGALLRCQVLAASQRCGPLRKSAHQTGFHEAPHLSLVHAKRLGSRVPRKCSSNFFGLPSFAGRLISTRLMHSYCRRGRCGYGAGYAGDQQGRRQGSGGAAGRHGLGRGGQGRLAGVGSQQQAGEPERAAVSNMGSAVGLF